MTATNNYLTNEFRQVFRNLDCTERVRTINIEEWVKYCKHAGATVLILDIKNYCVLYDSAFLPKHPVLGKRDLAAELASAAKKHGLKYGFYYSAPCQNDCLAGLHDDWQQRTPEGTLEATNWRSRAFFCPNNPGFSRLLASTMREITDKYRPHCYYFDNCTMGHSACYCDQCKAKYLRETGKPMPLTPDWDSPDWHELLRWRRGELEQWIRLLHDAIKGVDPRVAIIGNTGAYPFVGWQPAYSPAMCRYLDYPGLELFPGIGSVTFYATYGEALTWGLSAERALKNGGLANAYTWLGVGTPKAEAVTHYNLTLAAGGMPCLQESCKYLPALLRRVKQTEPYLKDMVSGADIALHYSFLAQESYYRPANKAEDKPFFSEVQGLYKALLNSHLPTEVIHDDWVEQLELQDFRTIVLPNIAHLKPEARRRLQAYVEAGGTVLATMETGLRDELGRRQGRELLWEGSGLTFLDDIVTPTPQMVHYPKPTGCEVEDDIPATPDQFLVFKSSREVKHWLGEDMDLGKRPDGTETRERYGFAGVPSCHLPVKAVEIKADKNWETLVSFRFRRDKAKGWIDCPAIVTRKYGRGRIVYANFQLGTLTSSGLYWLTGLLGHPWWRHLTAQLVAQASGLPAVRITAPTCVKFFLWRQPARQRYVIHLVNELSSAGLRDAQREDLVPVPVTARIALPGLRQVRAVIGGKGCVIKRAGRHWTVTHPGVAERLVLACQVDG
jgi:hypothetical protein